MICMVCKCTDESACIDEVTGQTCSWAEFEDGIVSIGELGLCSFCAAAADAGDPEVLARIQEVMHHAVRRGPHAGTLPDTEGEDEPRVQLYSDYEATQFLRARAAGA
jgi:hypothetical protein